MHQHVNKHKPFPGMRKQIDVSQVSQAGEFNDTVDLTGKGGLAGLLEIWKDTTATILLPSQYDYIKKMPLSQEHLHLRKPDNTILEF